MTERRNEELKLQDYLDGRLPEEERERFESRLEREPKLARRVAAAREIGDSLREADEDFSPGFYTRARAAFEEASKGREARRWFRPLSWETAGLAAVVLVAAALYLPGLVQSPSVRDAFTTPPPDEKAAVRWVETEEEVAAGDVIDDELLRQKALAEPEGLGAVAKKEAPRAGAARDKGEDREAETAWAPVPSAEAQSDEAPPPAPEARGRTEPDAGMVYTEADAARYSKRSAQAADGKSEDLFIATPLPAELVEPGALRVIDDPEEWRALLAASAEEALARLGGHDPDSRLVLIGARPEPFDCATLSVVATDARYWILLSPPVEGGRAAEHGCALLLPRDGRAIEIGPGAAD